MIAGKVYTLSGYEEEGYLQHVASYINTKISEITDRDEFRRIPNDMKAILIHLNIADDFFKARSQYDAAEENYKKAEKELFELKHELVDAQMRIEELLEKLSRERREQTQKTDREHSLEENYQKLEDKYRLLLNNAKVAEEKNKQFEEMLRLTQQEKREIEAVNKELRLNKEKLEATLADALLGAASASAASKEDGQGTGRDYAPGKSRTSKSGAVRKEEAVLPGRQQAAETKNIHEVRAAGTGHAAAAQAPETGHSGGPRTVKASHAQASEGNRSREAGASETAGSGGARSTESGGQAGMSETDSPSEDEEAFLTPAELSKEEISELREAVHEAMAELAEEDFAEGNIDILSVLVKPARKNSGRGNRPAGTGLCCQSVQPAG